jgi:hypothetical protein
MSQMSDSSLSEKARFEFYYKEECQKILDEQNDTARNEYDTQCYRKRVQFIRAFQYAHAHQLEIPIEPKHESYEEYLEKKRLEQQRGEDDQKIQQEVRDKMSTLDLEEYDSKNMNNEEEHEA